MVAPHYKDVDLDLLMTGAILHDIGKVEELNYGRSFGYSSEGQLLGHIIIGLRIVGEKLACLPDFPPKLRTLLEHMIISHHGELAFGSPKVPLFVPKHCSFITWTISIPNGGDAKRNPPR